MNIDCVDFYFLTIGVLQFPDEQPLDLWIFFERKDEEV